MKWMWFISGLLFMGSCRNNHAEPLSGNDFVVKDSVGLMMVNISGDLGLKGPIAWLDYFENSPDFYMASEGGIAFSDYAAARQFIETRLTKSIKHVDLHWDHVRITPLNTSAAALGADFHEDLTDSAGKILSEEGYFTAVADKSKQGWRLKNVHWSLLKQKNP